MLLGDTEESQYLRPEFLRSGLRFADGCRCPNLAPGQRATEAEPHDPILQMMTTGGGRRFADWRLWVWPLPPPGPLTFVCLWPAFDIPESRAEIDAALVLDAADRSIQVWPEPDV